MLGDKEFEERMRKFNHMVIKKFLVPIFVSAFTAIGIYALLTGSLPIG